MTGKTRKRSRTCSILTIIRLELVNNPTTFFWSVFPRTRAEYGD